MRKSKHYFRHNEYGFEDWLKAVKDSQAILRLSETYPSYRSNNEEEVKEALRIINQLNLVNYTLSDIEKKTLDKILKGKKLSQEESFKRRNIYENWLIVISRNREHQLKLPTREDIGKAIRAARIESGLSIEQIAGALNITTRTINRYEKGKVFPRVDYLYGMLILYEIKFEELIGIKN